MTSLQDKTVGVAQHPTDACGWLDQLRNALLSGGFSPEAEELLWGLSASVELLVDEHKGMAEELLCIYEQLGVVFEVTRRLPNVQNEPEVVELFLESLRRSFDQRTVSVGRLLPGGGWHVQEREIRAGEWIDSLLNRTRECGKVVVEHPPAAESHPAVLTEVMVAPVFAGETFICAIMLARRASVPVFRAVDMMLVESLATFCGDLIRNHRLLRELRGMSVAMVRSLVNAVDQKDEYTSGHSLRVGYFATLLGTRLNLGEIELQMLQWSALLHDVGKIGIRDDVLKKEGKLTPAEFEHIKEHPERSHRVVQEVPQLADALAGVLHHHEHYNGSGYPAGLKGEGIPLQARIIQIADVFDALTSNRSYRPAFEWPAALGILKEEAGKTVDPRLQRIFDQLMREMLDGDPNAWKRLVRKANEFSQTEADDSSGAGRE